MLENLILLSYFCEVISFSKPVVRHTKYQFFT